MQPVILPTAIEVSAASPFWGLSESVPPPVGISLIQPDGVMVTAPSLSSLAREDASFRTPQWVTHGSSYPPAVLPNDSRQPSLSGKIFVQQNWDALVGELIQAGLAEQSDGAARLTCPVEVKGIRVSSRPLKALEELQWLIQAHAADSRVFGGFIEPSSGGWEYSDGDVMARLRDLSAVLATPQATEADRALHKRVLRTAIKRTESAIDSMRPRPAAGS